MKAQDTQEKLDRGAKMIWRVKEEAERGAIAACEAGDYDTAATLHEVAGLLQIAYGKGRTITAMTDQGGIQPRGGGK